MPPRARRASPWETFVRTVRSKAARRQQIIENVQQQVQAHWRGVDPYDGKAVQEFVARAAQVTGSGQQQAVSLAAATMKSYLSAEGIDLRYSPKVSPNVRYYSEHTNDHAKSEKVREDGEVTERISVEEPFDRVAREYRFAIHEGKSAEEALAKSLERATMIVDENIALAERQAEHLILQKASKDNPGKILGYRRVIHPEASRTGSCGLCIVASDQVYAVSDLKALHAQCKCETVPIFKGNDPGLKLNTADLNAIYKAAGNSTAAKDLLNVRYKIDPNQELGPQLTKAADSGPVGRFSINPASEGEDPNKFARTQVANMTRRLNKLLAEGRGEDDRQVAYSRKTIQKFQQQLAS